MEEGVPDLLGKHVIFRDGITQRVADPTHCGTYPFEEHLPEDLYDSLLASCRKSVFNPQSEFMVAIMPLLVFF